MILLRSMAARPDGGESLKELCTYIPRWLLMSVLIYIFGWGVLAIRPALNITLKMLYSIAVAQISNLLYGYAINRW